MRVEAGGALTTVAAADGPNSVAVAADGTIYATERTHPWILRVDGTTGAVTRLPYGGNHSMRTRGGRRR